VDTIQARPLFITMYVHAEKLRPGFRIWLQSRESQDPPIEICPVRMGIGVREALSRSQSGEQKS
jgi:hypothetical protein